MNHNVRLSDTFLFRLLHSFKKKKKLPWLISARGRGWRADISVPRIAAARPRNNWYDESKHMNGFPADNRIGLVSYGKGFKNEKLILHERISGG